MINLEVSSFTKYFNRFANRKKKIKHTILTRNNINIVTLSTNPFYYDYYLFKTNANMTELNKNDSKNDKNVIKSVYNLAQFLIKFFLYLILFKTSICKRLNIYVLLMIIPSNSNCGFAIKL